MPPSPLLDLCVSSLRRGHANLLCIVPILSDDPRRESTYVCLCICEYLHVRTCTQDSVLNFTASIHIRASPSIHISVMSPESSEDLVSGAMNR